MRADTLRDYAAWRRLVAGVVQRGISSGLFTTRQAPERIAVLALALVDGVGIPLARATRRSPRTGLPPMCWPRWPRCWAGATPARSSLRGDAARPPRQPTASTG
jgi:hypothetical protein